MIAYFASEACAPPFPAFGQDQALALLSRSGPKLPMMRNLGDAESLLFLPLLWMGARDRRRSCNLVDHPTTLFLSEHSNYMIRKSLLLQPHHRNTPKRWNDETAMCHRSGLDACSSLGISLWPVLGKVVLTVWYPFALRNALLASKKVIEEVSNALRNGLRQLNCLVLWILCRRGLVHFEFAFYRFLAGT